MTQVILLFGLVVRTSSSVRNRGPVVELLLVAVVAKERGKRKKRS